MPSITYHLEYTMFRSPGDPEKVSAAIKSSGRRYADIAREVGVSYASVAAYAVEARTPSAGVLARLAKAVGVDPRSLLSEDSRRLFGGAA